MTDPDKLTKKHKDLVHMENRKVESHVQREDGDWLLNTLRIEGYDVPFQYRRKERYQDLQGQRVNLTFYREEQDIGGLAMEVMKVVRLRRA